MAEMLHVELYKMSMLHKQTLIGTLPSMGASGLLQTCGGSRSGFAVQRHGAASAGIIHCINVCRDSTLKRPLPGLGIHLRMHQAPFQHVKHA